MEVDLSSWAAYLIGYLIYFQYLYYLLNKFVQVCVVPQKQ